MEIGTGKGGNTEMLASGDQLQHGGVSLQGDLFAPGASNTEEELDKCGSED